MTLIGFMRRPAERREIEGISKDFCGFAYERDRQLDDVTLSEINRIAKRGPPYPSWFINPSWFIK